MSLLQQRRLNIFSESRPPFRPFLAKDRRQQRSLTMMTNKTMLRITALFALIASATAAPALVWSKESSSIETVYTSAPIKPEELLNDVVPVGSSAVVFLLARDGSSGSETLTGIAPLLSRTAESQPSVVHSHVSEMKNGGLLQKTGTQQGHDSLVVNLEELSLKLNVVAAPLEAEVVVDSAAATMMSKTQAKKSKRAKQLEKANLLIVNVDAGVDPEQLDAAVMQAVGHAGIDNVVLTAVRGVNEVKHERRLMEERRLTSMHKAGRKLQQQQQQRRRLEDAQQDGDENQNNNNSDLEGVYYVSLTPNILAGILFFLLFATVTWIGVSCMGMISGQDLYVKKMPTIGREA